MNELRKQYYEVDRLDIDGDFVIIKFAGQLDSEGDVVMTFNPEFEREAHNMKKRLEAQENEREQEVINALSHGHNIYLTFVAMQTEIDRLTKRLGGLS